MESLNQLLEYRDKVAKLSEKEKVLINLYIKKISDGELYGPMTGFSSLDKPQFKYYEEENIGKKAPKKNMYNFMREYNIRHLDDDLILYFNRRIKVREVFEKIDELERSFRKMGVKKGDKVSICSVTVPETIFTIYALNKIGAVCNLLDPRNNKNTITDNIKLTDSKILITIDELLPLLKEPIDDSTIDTVISASAVNSADAITKVGALLKGKKNNVKLSKELISFNDFIKYGEGYDISSYDNEYNDEAAIVYTSGSETGVPKSVILTNDNINGVVYQYLNSGIPIKRGEKDLNIMPPFLAYGLVNGIHLPTVLGVVNIPVAKFNPSMFTSLLKKYKPEHFMGVPNHYNYLVNSKEDIDLSFFKTPGMGGAMITLKLESEVNDYLKDHNCSSVAQKGYGMTEMCGPITTCTDKVNALGSVGIPLINNVIGVFEPNTDKELRYNERGEICAKGPGMMKTYFNKPELNDKIKKLHNDGEVWVHTGDEGYIDENGLLYITGRIKNIIQRPDGHNNYPYAIENVIASFPAVEKCAVSTINLESRGEVGDVPVAFVVLKEEEKPSDYSELSNYCLENMPKRDVACHYIFTKELPINAGGKIDYPLLKKQLKEMALNDNEIMDTIFNNYMNSVKMEKTLHI